MDDVQEVPIRRQGTAVRFYIAEFAAVFGRWDWADAEIPGEKLGLFGWEALAYVRLFPSSEVLVTVVFSKGQTFSTHLSLVPGQALST